MSAPRVHAVVPIKPLAECKLRLAPALDIAQRGRLVLAMLERVLIAARGAEGVEDAVVLGGDEPVQALCRRLHVVRQDDPAHDLNAALQSAYAETCARGQGAMLYLAGDLPALRAADVAALVAALQTQDIVLGPGARGGTNAILLRCGLPFRFDLGGRSLQRHQAQAQTLGLRSRTAAIPALHADVDTPADLLRLRRADAHLWAQVSGAEASAGSGAS